MKKGYLKTSDCARIYYEERGDGDPIVFVPGHMCTSKFFEKNAEALSKNYRVITMDPRGFGNSSKVLHGNNIERNSEDLKELVEYLQLERIMLVGWSLGGSIVMTYAKKYQEAHVKAVSLVDCALFPFSGDSWNQYNARNYNMDQWSVKYNEWLYQTERYYDNFMERIDRGLSQEEYQALRREIEKTPPWIGFAVHTDWCHTDTECYLKELTVPVLLISGEDGAMGRHYYNQLKGYKELHEFLESGHAMFITEQERFDHVLERFLDNIDQKQMSLIS